MTQALKKKGYNEAKNLNKILTNFKQLPCISSIKSRVCTSEKKNNFSEVHPIKPFRHKCEEPL